MARLGKAEITAKKDLAEELVACPEWGGEVLVRELDGKGRAAFVGAANDYRKAKEGGAAETDDVVMVYDLMLKLVAASAINPDSDKADLFSPEELAGKNGDVVQRLGEAAMRLSKLGAAEQKKETANLPAAQSSASTTA